MRRTIREVLKELLPQNFSFDIVIRVHKSFYRNDFNQIKLAGRSDMNYPEREYHYQILPESSIKGTMALIFIERS